MRCFLRNALQENGFSVIEAHDGQEAILRASIDRPALIVLDLGLPDLAGLDLVKRVRECTNVPIIGLTTASCDVAKDRLVATGADDYLVKPFGGRTLAARIHARLREKARAASPARTKLRFGGIAIDLARGRVTRNGEDVDLTSQEYAVLRVLTRDVGRVLKPQQILADVWGTRVGSDRLHAYIHRLRRKLTVDRSAPSVIVTERGGYRIASGPGGAPAADAA